MTERIPCTQCRKRKETEQELKTLKSEHKKLQRKMAHRINTIGDLKDTIKKLRASIKEVRGQISRRDKRHNDLLVDRDALRKALRDLKKLINAAIEESHFG